MLRAATVICPNCQHEFLVPEHASETLCPSCDEHIVWRQCRDTGEAFPVLSSWTTWTHANCERLHTVDLSVRIARPGPRPSADVPPPEPATPDRPTTEAPMADEDETNEPFQVLAEDADWPERGLRGWLYVDTEELVMVSRDEQDREVGTLVARIEDISEFEIGLDGAEHRRLFRHAKPRSHLLLRNATGEVRLEVAVPPQELRDALASGMRGSSWFDVGSGSVLDPGADAVQDDVEADVEGTARGQVR